LPQQEGHVSVHREGTERRRSERAVRESEARLQALIEASPLGIDVMDLEGNPVFYNPKCEELHGIGLDAASGKGWEDAVHPEDRERVDASWYAAASKGQPWSDTYRFLHPDGKVVWVSGRAAPMRIDGQLVGFVGTLEDITAEREARERAEHAIRIRDELLAVVAHDLRSPLNTITLTVRALLADSRGEQSRALEMVRRSADTMERLISDLLDLSLRSGRFNVQRSRLDLDALCHETIELFGAEARSRGIALSCRIDSGLPTVRGDPHRLAQLLSNLIGNALKFTEPPGEVGIRARRCDDGVQISVEDNGPGIRREHLPHLFEPHWQGAGSASGTGLGLSIARSIVEAHGGRIWADSTPGEGTTVHFVLPSSA
jgi:PAS domain S-box-containing protein